MAEALSAADGVLKRIRQKAEDAHHAEQAYKQFLDERNALVWEARQLAAPPTFREIAEAMGTTHPAVQKIYAEVNKAKQGVKK